MSTSNQRSPGWWVPTLYFAEGLPYMLVTSVAYLALLQLGWPADQAAMWTSWLTWPWILKPLWGPVVERYGTRRGWVVATQLAGAALMLGAGLALLHGTWGSVSTAGSAPAINPSASTGNSPLPDHGAPLWPLVLLLGLGLVSATHDIAADGFYLLALGPRTQVALSGVRGAFYKLALVTGGGGLVILAGYAEKTGGAGAPQAWLLAFAVAAGLLLVIGLYHTFLLPRPAADGPPAAGRPLAGEFARSWTTFVRRPGFGRMLAFMLLYRFGEGQLLKGNQPFFLAPREHGGLGLDLHAIGLLYGTFGTGALFLGLVLGGLVIARTGLRRQLWPMALAINVPHLLYVWLAWTQPVSHALIGAGVALEQFGYGYGYSAYMAYLLYVARGPHPASHYALCTGAMALGLFLAGLSGAAALAHFGDHYRQFFLWITACAAVTFATLWKLPLAGDFGKKENAP